ncbi:putative baseplate assembly protein [Actinoplanes awajinensis]|uniref:Uncharacterized protein n=1 Tax=Actinoplanes awajinensis subsp. mycoplanecinus TaxID=135947 RepID=A0A124G8E0_9ACTN|nr:putative baseplate assembly protein [Actinoplanes awajinensis]KUL25600.1 hypothetical protein ADL15_40355 [Actinoplanes awajinensis subsp. mycoplanecinus]
MAVDATDKDYEALRTAMLDLAAELLPAWTDHSPGDLGTLLVELFAYAGDILTYYQDRIAAESYLATATEPQSLRHLLRLIGYEPTPAQPASADLTLLCADRAGALHVPSGATFVTGAADPVRFRYLGAAQRVDLGSLPLVEHRGNSYRRFCPDNVIGEDRLNGTLPVQECVEQCTDLVGISDGSVWQRFALDRSPVVTESVELVVTGGGGGDEPTSWKRQTTLLGSGPADTHYQLTHGDVGTVSVEFGDGRTGQIPRSGDHVTVSYRVGGGAHGNVPADSIVRPDPAIPGVEVVLNETAASGGVDAQTPAEAARRAPALFRTANRAVTGADYENLACSFGIAKAYARPVEANIVELFVAPAGGGLPSDLLLHDLHQWLEGKRLLTVQLRLRPPAYVPVQIQATWGVEPHRFFADVQQRLERAIADVVAFNRVRFGDTVYLSKIYEAAESVDGLSFINVTRFQRADRAAPDLPQDGRLSFEEHEIPLVDPPRDIELHPAGGGDVR